MGSNPTGPASIPPVPSSSVEPTTFGSAPPVAAYLWELQKQGYKPQTIQSHGQILRLLSRQCKLEDPETVRTYLASAKISLGRKENIANVYSKYAKFSGVVFDKPRYHREDSLPKIPLEQWLLDVINAARHIRHATTLRGLYETGARVGEWCSLTAKDFDFHRKLVSLRPEKNSKARECRLSETLLGMVQQCIIKNPIHPFPNPSAIKKHLNRTTHYLANANSQPAYLDIHAHIFRHYRATRLYWETKDILFVKNWLGHRSISSTMKYLQLVDMNGDEQYIVKVAKSLEEYTGLLEQGFQYVSDYQGCQVLRKRK